MRNCYSFHARAALLIALLFAGSANAQQIDIPAPPDSVAFGSSVIVLPNGNIVVADSNATVNTLSYVGAVYLYKPDGTLVSTLVGSNQGDTVGAAAGQAHIVVLANGNFVVPSPYWQNTAGAVTFGDANTGWGVGNTAVVSASNSLVGTQVGEYEGLQGVTVLSDGSYVVANSAWSGGGPPHAGAVTWGSGTAGVSGAVSSFNSLTGTIMNDSVGQDVIALPGGHYVVSSTAWNNNRGAATWVGGGGPTSDTVSALNSLVGDSPNDAVGRVYALTNGNYVVVSPYWNGGFGAATLSSGGDGHPFGSITASNSLVGSSNTDNVGDSGVTALTNGNYVVASSYWNGTAGAVTWGNGNTGAIGTVSANPSIVGSAANDYVGDYGAVALSNGNYVVASSSWNAGRGAVTWGNGATGTNVTVSSANSLVGTTANDYVGSQIIALSNGNYVSSSAYWNGNIGAATWGNGTNGNPKGAVAAANSLVGSSANDAVGNYLVALANGNYVAYTYAWNGGRGAVTWGNGSTGTTGTVTAGNSLVGTTANDGVGSNVIALSNGNYVSTNGSWNNGVATAAGAFTWGNGRSGTKGAVSTSNSVYGQLINDYVSAGNIKAFSNGSYAVQSGSWSDNGVFQGGAVTLCRGNTPYPGPITARNSVLGAATSGGGNMTFDYIPATDQLVVGRPNDHKVSLLRIDEVSRGDFEQH